MLTAGLEEDHLHQWTRATRALARMRLTCDNTRCVCNS
jgi:hypothetical protein